MFVLFFGSTLILFSYFLYNSFEKNQSQDLDVSLYNYTVDIVNSVKVDLFGSAFLSPDFTRNADKIFPFSLGKTFILFRDPSGQILVRSKNSLKHEFPWTDKAAEIVKNYGKMYQTILLDADEDSRTPMQRYRMITHNIDAPGGQRLVIQVAAPLDLLERQQRRLRNFFFVSIPVVLVLASLMGWLFTRGALQPVTDIITKAKKISVGNLSDRIPTPKIKDEIHMLVGSLNDLLSRLEGAFTSQERFIADASHQLKTPLAILKGELDLIKNKNLSAQETKEFLKSMGEEVETLSKIVENLLLLARVDAGIEKFKFEPVRMEEVLLNQISRLEKLAHTRENKIIFNMSEKEGGYEILGDDELLGCLFHNLIENAIKYSPEGKQIEINLFERQNELNVEVRDHGSGIAENEKEKIFDRFYRAGSNGTKATGYGLGLALAKKISEILGGYITVSNVVDGGAAFSFIIKKN